MKRRGALADAGRGIVTISFGILCVLAAFSSYAQDSKSSFTQNNGIRENATITDVDTEKYYSQYASSTDTYLTVTLPTPVNGRTRTVVNVSYDADYTDGQVIAVLVNPRNPGYAELPGHSYSDGWGTLVAWLVAIPLLLRGLVRTIDALARLSPGRDWVNAVDVPEAVRRDMPPEIYSYIRQT